MQEVWEDLNRTLVTDQVWMARDQVEVMVALEEVVMEVDPQAAGGVGAAQGLVGAAQGFVMELLICSVTP